MRDLPAIFRDHLIQYSLEARNPAYLQIGKNGELMEFGGDWNLYGVESLSRGKPALEQAFFLEGLLPLNQSPLVVPCVQINSGHYADIHIIRDSRRHWVILLGLTNTELVQRQILDKLNDYDLEHERHAKILNQYLGKELVKALDDGLVSICQSGERRHVSILFVDIRGFTSFSEINEPEVAFTTLNRYLETMIKPLLEESAVVDKIIGDAVMAVFGILTMTVSPPHQAVVAALKILAAVKELNGELARTGKPVLEVGIGISTGPVAVGILGSTVRKSFSVVGHHVNLAARLQEKANPFEILVDLNTYNEIIAYQKGFIEREIKLKGIADQVRVFGYHMQVL